MSHKYFISLMEEDLLFEKEGEINFDSNLFDNIEVDNIKTDNRSEFNCEQPNCPNKNNYGKGFSSKGNLYYHLKTKHGIDLRKNMKKSNESDKKSAVESDLENTLKFYETIKKFGGTNANLRDSLMDHFKETITDVKVQAYHIKSSFQKSIDLATNSIDDISSISNASISDRVRKVLSEIDAFEIEEISSIINRLNQSVELKKLKTDPKFIAVKSLLKVLDTPRSSHDDLSSPPSSRNGIIERGEASMDSSLIIPRTASSSSAEEASSTGKRSVLGMMSDAVLGKRKNDS